MLTAPDASRARGRARRPRARRPRRLDDVADRGAPRDARLRPGGPLARAPGLGPSRHPSHDVDRRLGRAPAGDGALAALRRAHLPSRARRPRILRAPPRRGAHHAPGVLARRHDVRAPDAPPHDVRPVRGRGGRAGRRVDAERRRRRSSAVRSTPSRHGASTSCTACTSNAPSTCRSSLLLAQRWLATGRGADLAGMTVLLAAQALAAYSLAYPAFAAVIPFVVVLALAMGAPPRRLVGGARRRRRGGGPRRPGEPPVSPRAGRRSRARARRGDLEPRGDAADAARVARELRRRARRAVPRRRVARARRGGRGGRAAARAPAGAVATRPLVAALLARRCPWSLLSLGPYAELAGRRPLAWLWDVVPGLARLPRAAALRLPRVAPRGRARRARGRGARTRSRAACRPPRRLARRGRARRRRLLAGRARPDPRSGRCPRRRRRSTAGSRDSRAPPTVVPSSRFPRAPSWDAGSSRGLLDARARASRWSTATAASRPRRIRSS